MKIRHLERIELEKNPLAEVICQITFPRNMEIEENLPSKFQLLIASEFPHLNVNRPRVVNFNFPSENGKGGVVEEKGAPIYNFENRDRNTRVSLSNDFLAVSTTDYREWKSFSEIVEKSLTSLLGVYSIPLINRVGIRYRNIIKREDVGLQDTPWLELIDPHALGISAYTGLFEANNFDESSVKSCRNLTQFELEMHSLIVQTGFSDIGNGTIGFILDNDFIRENSVDPDTSIVIKILEELHGDAESAFRHFIKEKLHSAYGRKPSSGN